MEYIIDLIVSILGCIIFALCSSFAKKLKNEIDNTNYDSVEITKRYIKKIKIQFYICFPSAIFISIWSQNTPNQSFFKAFQFVLAFFLFLLSLFAFMCSIDVIKNIYNERANDESNNSDN